MSCSVRDARRAAAARRLSRVPPARRLAVRLEALRARHARRRSLPRAESATARGPSRSRRGGLRSAARAKEACSGLLSKSLSLAIAFKDARMQRGKQALASEPRPRARCPCRWPRPGQALTGEVHCADRSRAVHFASSPGRPLRPARRIVSTRPLERRCSCRRAHLSRGLSGQALHVSTLCSARDSTGRSVQERGRPSFSRPTPPHSDSSTI